MPAMLAGGIVVAEGHESRSFSSEKSYSPKKFT